MFRCTSHAAKLTARPLNNRPRSFYTSTHKTHNQIFIGYIRPGHACGCVWGNDHEKRTNPFIMLSISAAIFVFMRWLQRSSMALARSIFHVAQKQSIPIKAIFTLIWLQYCPPPPPPPRLVAITSNTVNAYTLKLFVCVRTWRSGRLAGVLYIRRSSEDVNEFLMKWCSRESSSPHWQKLASGHLFIWLYTYIYLYSFHNKYTMAFKIKSAKIFFFLE